MVNKPPDTQTLRFEWGEEKPTQVFNQFRMFREIRAHRPMLHPKTVIFIERRAFCPRISHSLSESLKSAANFYISVFITVLSSMFEFSLLSLRNSIDAEGGMKANGSMIHWFPSETFLAIHFYILLFNPLSHSPHPHTPSASVQFESW